MPRHWHSWTRSMSCKSDIEQVAEPKPLSCSGPTAQSDGKIKRRSSHRSGGCSKSIANLRDVIHGNTRVVSKQTSSCNSPEKGDSQRQSTEYLTKVPLKLTEAKNGVKGGDGSRPGVSERSGASTGASNATSLPFYKGTPLRKFSGCYDCNMAYETLDSMLISREASVPHSGSVSPKFVCQKCGESFQKSDALVHHQISRHAVSEMGKDDSSRNVVEIIFRTSWLKETPYGRVDRILKIDNTDKTIARFEEYRAMVKTQASKQAKKQPRCLADGNELLRFYGTTLSCSLGVNGSSNLCNLATCNVCNIIRSGFTVKKDVRKGIYTTATSGKAHDSLRGEVSKGKHAMLVCRVIAGRVHKSCEDGTQFDGSASPHPGYDSRSGELGPAASLDDLVVFNPKAVLPCFVVVYRV